MEKLNLRYQPVTKADGSVSIHEALVTDEGNIQACSYDSVYLQAEDIGELQALLRQVYNDIRKFKAISEEELDAELYGKDEYINEFSNDEDNVISLCEYMCD